MERRIKKEQGKRKITKKKKSVAGAKHKA